MVSPPEPAAGTSTGGSWITSSCAPESTRTVASGSVSGPGPRRAASSATRKRTARMPAAPGVEVRDNIPAGVRFGDGRLLPECRGRLDVTLCSTRPTPQAVQRRGAGAEGPGGAGVEATAGGGAAGSGREPTILIFVPHD